MNAKNVTHTPDARNKISEAMKIKQHQVETFLKTYAVSRNKNKSLRAAGFSRSTLDNYMKKPIFKKRFEEAEDDYTEMLRSFLLKRIFKDDKSGRLLLRELERVDPSYRQKQEIAVDVNERRILVVPATLSMEQWQEKYGKNRIEKDEPKTIDVDANESTN
jgi:hypothetical protein